MDEMRGLIADMANQEKQLLDTRTQEVNSSIESTSQSIFGGTAL